MKKTHTIDTLKYYFGKDVYVQEHDVKDDPDYFKPVSKIIPGGVYKLLIMDADIRWVGIIDKKYDLDSLDHVLPKYVFPILKKQDSFLPSELEKALGHQEMIFPFPSAEAVKILLDLGCGAIPTEESPTGYVDLFGNPCITPKQVEEGFKL